MAAPLKIAATVTIDSSQATAGAKDAQVAVAGIGTAANTASNSLQRLIETSVGIGGSAANSNIREWSGALAMAGRSADELRAKYNPLFAVISQYKQNLIEIRTLTAQGVLTTDEMTAAIQRQRQATLASIDAIKGRNSAVHGGGAGANMAATNAMFQFQDIAMTSAMGMNPLMVGLQQGSQLAGGFAGMSAKEAGAAVLGGITGLLSPVSLVTVGLTAAAAAAIQFGSSMMESGSKTEKLDDVLQTHADLLKKLEERYGTLIDKAKGYGAESSRILAVSSSADLRALSRVSTTAGLDFFNEVGVVRNNVRGGGDFAVDTKYAAFADALKKLREEAKSGKPDFEAFYDTIGRVAETNPQFAKQADELAKLVSQYRDARQALEELKRIRDALFNDRGPNGLLLSQGTTAQGDRNAAGLFDIQQAQEAKRTAQAMAAQLQEIQARTVAERVAAAKANAAAQYNETETPDARRTRISNAGILAQTQAEKELADAKRDRLRSIDQTLESARLELTLIGQTTSSMEAQRMEVRLLTEAKIAAEKAGTSVSADEVERIKQAALEYGKLQEAIKATNVLRDQADNLQQLRLEISLVGQSEAVRQRALALAQAERTIRDQGISANSREAQQIRANAAAMAEETLRLDRLQDAWHTVQSAGENAIDRIGDALQSGDWAGALKGVLADIQKSFITLGITNPLKNALFGTNYGTLSDLGSLFGGSAATSAGMSSVGAMNVTAANVVINGGIGSGLGGLFGGAANDNAPRALASFMPTASSVGASTTGQGGVAAQVWNFFAGKGLKDFQIAGIMGNVSRESAFNPTAVGDGGNALGLMQWNDRAPSLLSSIGGRANLGDVQSQLEFAWKELQTSESRSLSRLMGSTNLRDATSAFAGFERPRGWSALNPEGADGFGERLKGAQEALSKFGGTVNSAGSGLGNLSNGFKSLSGGLDNMGSGLNAFSNKLNSFPAAPSSGGGGLFSSLFSGLFGGGLNSYGQSVFGSSAQFATAWKGGGIGLYDDGGWTGPGAAKDVAGVVHADEFVFSKRAVQKIGVAKLEALHQGLLRGYENGGHVSSGGAYYPLIANSNDANPVAGTSIQIINNSSVPIREEREESQDQNGRRQIKFTMSDRIGEAVEVKGGGFQRAMRNQYGLKTRGIPR